MWTHLLEFNKSVVPVCVCVSDSACVYSMLTLSSTKLHCVFTCRPCRGGTLSGMGSRPLVHLFFNEQMAAQVVWPLNKPANSSSQLTTGTFWEFPNPNPPSHISIHPPVLLSSQLALLPCLSLSTPASIWGSPPLQRTERLIVWKLHRQCFYWRPALPLTLAAWALLGSQMPGLSSAPERALSLGVLGTRTHTQCPAPVSALHLTPQERQKERQKRGKWCAEKKQREREEGQSW